MVANSFHLMSPIGDMPGALRAIPRASLGSWVNEVPVYRHHWFLRE